MEGFRTIQTKILTRPTVFVSRCSIVKTVYTGCSPADVRLCATITYCLIPFPSFQICSRHIFRALLPMVAKGRRLQIKGHLVQLQFRFPQLLMCFAKISFLYPLLMELKLLAFSHPFKYFLLSAQLVLNDAFYYSMELNNCENPQHA